MSVYSSAWALSLTQAYVEVSLDYYHCFRFFLSNPMLPLFLQLPKKGPRPKWTKYKHIPNKKCLSVGNFGILSGLLSVDYSATPAYVEIRNID